MKTDKEIKNNVLDELAYQPNINETRIGVNIENDKVALKIKRVKAVAEDIEVISGISYKKKDKEIAKAIVNAFKWISSVPEDDIIIKVENGWVFLSGKVQWLYQKKAAKNTIKNLLGVKGVSNSIKLENNNEPKVVKHRIKTVFNRMALID